MSPTNTINNNFLYQHQRRESNAGRRSKRRCMCLFYVRRRAHNQRSHTVRGLQARDMAAACQRQTPRYACVVSESTEKR
jgi:hypothetical protein